MKWTQRPFNSSALSVMSHGLPPATGAAVAAERKLSGDKGTFDLFQKVLDVKVKGSSHPSTANSHMHFNDSHSLCSFCLWDVLETFLEVTFLWHREKRWGLFGENSGAVQKAHESAGVPEESSGSSTA